MDVAVGGSVLLAFAIMLRQPDFYFLFFNSSLFFISLTDGGEPLIHFDL